MSLTTDWTELHRTTIAEEEALSFESFGYSDAWRLGSTLVELGTSRGLPIAISIRLGQQQVFHAALIGSAATNDDWLRRKIATVLRHNTSSYAQGLLQRSTATDYFLAGGYDRATSALAGGAVPIRLGDMVIGAVAVSGLAEEDDHALVIEALRAVRQAR